MKARGAICNYEKEGVGSVGSTQLYQQPLSLNNVQMAGSTFESKQNEATWLNPLTTLILIRTPEIWETLQFIDKESKVGWVDFYKAA